MGQRYVREYAHLWWYVALFSWFILITPGSVWGQSQDTLHLSDIPFKSELDGRIQYYVELLPGKFDANEGHDLIIGLHGHGSDRWQFAKDERAECAAFRVIAAKYRIIAISPDYRAKTSWMGPAAEMDLQQIIKQLKGRYKIRRVFLIGASMGGTSALTFSAMHPDLIDGVTAMNAHANHLEYDNFQDAIAASFGGEKAAIPLEYKMRSAEYWPEKLTMPIGLTIGGQDTIVPPQSVIRLEKVLKKIGQDALLIAQPQGGHVTDFEDAMKAMEFMINTRKKK